MMKKIICGVLIIISVTVCFSMAAVAPAVVQSGKDWTLDVKYEHPQQIMIDIAGSTKPMRFWYLIVTLTNKTGGDVDFYPKCELMTDTFKLTPAGKGTSRAVFARIKRRHKTKYPFLEYLENADEKVLQGADNARDIVIIWPDFDSRAKNIKFFITGFSNETAVVKHPIAKDESGRPKKVFLRKTLELSYTLSGDPAFRSQTKLAPKTKRWIMR